MAADWFQTSLSGLPEGISLPAPARHILSILCWFAHNDTDDGGDIFPSERTLSESTGLTVRTIQRHLQLLEVAGMISIERHCCDNGGYKMNNHYRLLFPKRLTKDGCSGDDCRRAAAADVEAFFAQRPGKFSDDEQRQFRDYLEIVEYNTKQGPVTVRGLPNTFYWWRVHRQGG